MIEKIQQSFLLFCRNMEPTFDFAHHHKFLCDKVQNQIVEEKDGRLLLALPPGHGKSTVCSQMLPAYILGLDPSAKILLLTYGAQLSNDHGVKCRRYIESPAYKKIFPGTKILGQGVGGTFEVEGGGSLRGIGRGGSITGFRANYIILDDTIKDSKEAKSDTIVNNLHDWFSTTAYSRLLPGGGLVAFNTRWSKSDLIGFVLDNYKTPSGDLWEYINLPAIAEDNDPMGRQVGEALWPDYFTLDTMKEIKAASPLTFAALYQGNPTSQDSVPIKKTSLIAATITEFGQEYTQTVMAWDTASTRGSGDYTIGTVWKLSRESAILIDVVRDQVDFNGLLELYDKAQELYKPSTNIIEKASSGLQLLQLKPDHSISSGTIKADQKTALAESFNSSLLNKKIQILNGALSAADKNEVSEYPYGKHDDLPLSILHFYKNYLAEDLFRVRRITSDYKSVMTKASKLMSGDKKKHRKLKLRIS